MPKKTDTVLSSARVKTPAPLVAALEKELAAKKVPLRKRIQALAELFELFNRERDRIQGFRYLDIPKLRDAYLRYHLPLNMARVKCALEQVRRVHPQLDTLEHIVDLGAGPATASLATLFTLPRDVQREYLLYDRSRAALQIGRRLFGSSLEAEPSDDAPDQKAPTITTHITSLPSVPTLPRQALVYLAMVLNEIGVGLPGGPDAEVILSRLRRALAPPSVVLIVEPALRLPGRNLLAFHDMALETGGWQVLAPCTHQRACPLLQVRGKAWCHFRMSWAAPNFVREVADPLELAWQTPAFSFLALLRTDEPQAPFEKQARVIGDVMPLKEGKHGIYLCQSGERRLRQLRGERVERGDIVEARQDARLVVKRPWGRW